MSCPKYCISWPQALCKWEEITDIYENYDESNFIIRKYHAMLKVGPMDSEGDDLTSATSNQGKSNSLHLIFYVLPEVFVI